MGAPLAAHSRSGPSGTKKGRPKSSLLRPRMPCGRRSTCIATTPPSRRCRSSGGPAEGRARAQREPEVVADGAPLARERGRHGEPEEGRAVADPGLGAVLDAGVDGAAPEDGVVAAEIVPETLEAIARRGRHGGRVAD